MFSVHSASPATPAAAASVQTAAPVSSDFWQRPFVRDILPFITSLSLHAMILIIGLMMYTAVKFVHTPLQIQTTSAETTLPAENAVPGVLGDNPKTPWEVTKQNLIREMDATGANSFKGTKMELPGGGANGDESASVFAGGPGSFGKAGLHGPGRGPGYGPGDGDGRLAPWGVPNTGGVTSPTFGKSNAATQIVFLCDATGSMLNKMATLKDELNKAVQSLTPRQSFDIIFYQDNYVESFSKSLTVATPENRRKAAAWLEGITAQGTTQPIPALETALKLHPQLIHFLTDAADFPDPVAVVDTINKYNKDRLIKVNTILFVEDKIEHEKNVDSEGLMKKISTENHGIFRWVEMDAIQQ